MKNFLKAFPVISMTLAGNVVVYIGDGGGMMLAGGRQAVGMRGVLDDERKGD